MVEVVCSRCKRALREPVGMVRSADNKYVIDRFYSGAGTAVPRATVEEFLTPARSATVSADVVVPFLQALVTGLMTTLVAVVPVYFLRLPFQVTLLAGGIALCMTWLYLLADHRKSLWSHERYERDIEQPVAPSLIDQARPKEVKVKLAVNESTGRMRFGHLPIDHERLCSMARALKNGRSFSVSAWSGRGKLLSRSEFETLRDWLLDSNYAQWRDDHNRNLGVEFTSRGEAFWRALAES